MLSFICKSAADYRDLQVQHNGRKLITENFGVTKKHSRNIQHSARRKLETYHSSQQPAVGVFKYLGRRKPSACSRAIIDDLTLYSKKFNY